MVVVYIVIMIVFLFAVIVLLYFTFKISKSWESGNTDSLPDDYPASLIPDDKTNKTNSSSFSFSMSATRIKNMNKANKAKYVEVKVPITVMHRENGTIKQPDAAHSLEKIQVSTSILKNIGKAKFIDVEVPITVIASENAIIKQPDAAHSSEKNQLPTSPMNQANKAIFFEPITGMASENAKINQPAATHSPDKYDVSGNPNTIINQPGSVIENIKIYQPEPSDSIKADDNEHIKIYHTESKFTSEAYQVDGNENKKHYQRSSTYPSYYPRPLSPLNRQGQFLNPTEYTSSYYPTPTSPQSTQGQFQNLAEYSEPAPAFPLNEMPLENIIDKDLDGNYYGYEYQEYQNGNQDYDSENAKINQPAVTHSPDKYEVSGNPNTIINQPGSIIENIKIYQPEPSDSIKADDNEHIKIYHTESKFTSEAYQVDGNENKKHYQRSSTYPSYYPRPISPLNIQGQFLNPTEYTSSYYPTPKSTQGQFQNLAEYSEPAPAFPLNEMRLENNIDKDLDGNYYGYQYQEYQNGNHDYDSLHRTV
jgi:Ca2+/Na+ antiporter